MLLGLDILIKYRPGKLNPTDTFFWRPDYEEKDSTLVIKPSFLIIVQEQRFIEQKYPSEIASLDFTIFEPSRLSAEFEKQSNFILLGIIGKNCKILSCSKLKSAEINEFGYEKVSLTMQIVINILQEVDPLSEVSVSCIIKVGVYSHNCFLYWFYSTKELHHSKTRSSGW